MKITDLVGFLNNVKETFGDLDVCIATEHIDGHVDDYVSTDGASVYNSVILIPGEE